MGRETDRSVDSRERVESCGRQRIGTRRAGAAHPLTAPLTPFSNDQRVRHDGSLVQIEALERAQAANTGTSSSTVSP